MLVIRLIELIFYAHHGLFAEEKTLGNTFVVSVEVRIKPLEWTKLPYQLGDTVDYGEVYKLVSGRMKEPEALLENLVTQLSEAIFALSERIEYVSVAVKKQNPPLGGLAQASEVVLVLSKAEFEQLKI